MGKAEEIRAEQEKAEIANPIIIEGLRVGTEPIILGREIAQRFDLDERTAYRWVTITEESFDRSRRRIAGIGVAVLVLGFGLVLAGVLLRVLGSDLVARPLAPGLAAGAPLATAGLLLGLKSRKLAR